MRLRFSAITALLLSVAFNALADQDSMYCSTNHGYIRLGMTEDEVISACGQPLNKKESNEPIMQKIPVLQLIYNVQGAQSAFYGVWALPVGVDVGAKLEVEVINDKISGVILNGGNTNAFSICGANMIQIGDPVSLVYDYCGSPSLVNNTFINKPIQSENPPQIWTYQTDEYQPPFTLIFLNGRLQTIH